MVLHRWWDAPISSPGTLSLSICIMMPRVETGGPQLEFPGAKWNPPSGPGAACLAGAAEDGPHGEEPGRGSLPKVFRNRGLFLQCLRLVLPHPTSPIERIVVEEQELPRFTALRERAASGFQFTLEQATNEALDNGSDEDGCDEEDCGSDNGNCSD